MDRKIRNILERPMDRKEFLRHIGVFFLTLIGVTALIQYFTGANGLNHSASGYGSDAYGGHAEGIS